jgi:hypothetical protein
MAKKGSILTSNTAILVTAVLVVGLGVFLFGDKKHKAHGQKPKGGHHHGGHGGPPPVHHAHLAQYKTGEMYYLEEQPISLLYNDY